MQNVKCSNGICVDLTKSSLGRALIGFNENKFDSIEINLLEKQLNLRDFEQSR